MPKGGHVGLVQRSAVVVRCLVVSIMQVFVLKLAIVIAVIGISEVGRTSA